MVGVGFAGWVKVVVVLVRMGSVVLLRSAAATPAGAAADAACVLVSHPVWWLPALVSPLLPNYSAAAEGAGRPLKLPRVEEG